MFRFRVCKNEVSTHEMSNLRNCWVLRRQSVGVDEDDHEWTSIFCLSHNTESGGASSR